MKNPLNLGLHRNNRNNPGSNETCKAPRKGVTGHILYWGLKIDYKFSFIKVQNKKVVPKFHVETIIFFCYLIFFNNRKQEKMYERLCTYIIRNFLIKNLYLLMTSTINTLFTGLGCGAQWKIMGRENKIML